jgi:hypothetical protein
MGSLVWYDTNGNGIRDRGEAGVPDVTVTLYDQGNHPIATTTTDSNGSYQFASLAPGEYTIGFSSLPPGFTFTIPNRGGDDGNDSDVNPATGRTGPITLATGENNATIFAGLINPTAITLTSFTATWQGDQVVVRWATGAEWRTWGFQLYRSTDGTRANAVLVTPQLIPARGSNSGASYTWVDTNVQSGSHYTYWLVETEVDGTTQEYGPVRPTSTPTIAPYAMYLPLIQH